MCPGVLVGNARDLRIKSGVTVVTGPEPFQASVHVSGGGPATRMTEGLVPGRNEIPVDAVALSGGSAQGLDAVGGVMEVLRAEGRGLPVRTAKVPIVAGGAVLDLSNGGAEDWPEGVYAALGRTACRAAGEVFGIGTEGAGTSVTTAGLKGGLGSASAVLESGVSVGALVVVNPSGQVTSGEGPGFLAQPFEEAGEFGGLPPAPSAGPRMETRPEMGANTVLGVVATDLALSRAQLYRLAVMAGDGIARAVMPVHTVFDGDMVFALSTGARESAAAEVELVGVGHAAAVCLSRAIARAVHAATPLPGDPWPTWAEKFGTR